MNKLMLALLLCGTTGAALAADGLPVGLWKTMDEQTQKEKSYVRITDAGGVLTGRIERLADARRPDAVCDRCVDDRKGQPLTGLAILRDVRQDPADAGLWQGGDVLDPSDGKVYKVRLKPVDGGKRLEVRAYIGSPMMGRTQTWLRIE